MTPLVRSTFPAEELLKAMREISVRWENRDKATREAFGDDEQEAARKIIDWVQNDLGAEEVYVNDQYQVNVRRDGKQVHLSVKRRDKEPVRDWRDMQEIKNQLVGPECEGVELYPAESRLIDTANQFHMWCSSDPTFRFPIGWDQGRHVSNTLPGESAKQRPIKEPCRYCGEDDCPSPSDCPERRRHLREEAEKGGS